MQDGEHYFFDVEKYSDADSQSAARQREWRAVWLRCIGLAWLDDDFKKELMGDPRGTIKTHFDYDLPEHIDLFVEEGTGSYTLNADGPDKWVLTNSKLTVILPPKPAVGQEGIALADYADSGRTYPFTCA